MAKTHRASFLLLGLFLLGFFNVFHFGDYCSGLADAMLFIVIVFAFLIAYLVITLSNLSQKIKKGKKFYFLPTLILLTFLCTIILGLRYEGEPVFKKLILKGSSTEFNDLSLETLLLYDNGTFEIKTKFVDYGCIYKGDYAFEGDTLTLNRNDLKQLTGVFTNKYFFNKKDSLLISLKKDAVNIKVNANKKPQKLD